MMKIKNKALLTESESDEDFYVQECEEVASLTIQEAKNGKQADHIWEKGKYRNEVILKFDDGVEFYVAEDFLKMASPVFTKMLESDFKEKQEMMIDLKGKNSADFLELLNYLHPAVQKRITEYTVFKIIPLAEEYDVVTAIADCRDMLKAMLVQRKKQGIPGKSSVKYRVHQSHCDTLNACFDILEVSLVYSYSDIETTAMSIIASFPSKMYMKKYTAVGVKTYANKMCVQKYMELQENVKVKLLQERLDKCDDNCDIPIQCTAMYTTISPFC